MEFFCNSVNQPVLLYAALLGQWPHSNTVGKLPEALQIATRVEPAGSAVIGQRFYGESGPRFLHIGLKFEYTEVNAAQHRLGLNVQLPFSITVAKTWTAFPSATPDAALTTTATLASPRVGAVLSLAALCAAISTLDRLTRCHA